MNQIIADCCDALSASNFNALPTTVNEQELVLFEDPVVIGFVFAYANESDLIARWEDDVDKAIATYQFALRRAGPKAWNTYVVLLAEGSADLGAACLLANIEENLTGTRKIARAGVNSMSEVRAALLPLLPLQSPPELEAVNLRNEILLRTSELPPPVSEAFASEANISVVLQVIEQTP